MLKNMIKKTTLALAIGMIGAPLGTTVVNAAEVSEVAIDKGEVAGTEFNSEVLSKVNELEEKGYVVDKKIFSIEGEEFLKFSKDQEVGFIHTNANEVITVYVELDENNNPYGFIYQSPSEGTLQIRVDENGQPIHSDIATYGLACEQVIGGVGAVIGGIYGAAIGAVTANPLIGIGAGVAFNGAWTPVSHYGCK